VTGRLLFWFYAAHQLRAQLDTWAKMPNYTMRWDGASIEGFPFAARLRLTNATFGGTKLLPYEFSAPLLAIETAAWVGPDWHIAMPQGAKLGIPAVALTFDTTAIDVTVNVGGRNPTLVNFTVRDARGSEVVAGLHIDEVFGQLQIPGASPAKARTDFLSVNVNLDKLSSPWALPPRSDTIESAQIMADFNGTWPPGSLRDEVATWRDNGDHIDLVRGMLHWGAFQVLFITVC
jgi:Uncharacterized protein conserved in bacteria (DUF2125)